MVHFFLSVNVWGIHLSSFFYVIRCTKSSSDGWFMPAWTCCMRILFNVFVRTSLKTTLMFFFYASIVILKLLKPKPTNCNIHGIFSSHYEYDVLLLTDFLTGKAKIICLRLLNTIKNINMSGKIINIIIIWITYFQ